MPRRHLHQIRVLPLQRSTNVPLVLNRFSDRDGGNVVHSVVVRHNFEAAHRLPRLGGKCQNLHGHSWRVAVTASAPSLDDDGILVEFGGFKAHLRQWIDDRLDHGTMLGERDSLLGVLEPEDLKLFRFGSESGPGTDRRAADLPWPTVEAVAVLVGRVAHDVLGSLPGAADARITKVVVHETSVNTAEYQPRSLVA